MRYGIKQDNHSFLRAVYISLFNDNKTQSEMNKKISDRISTKQIIYNLIKDKEFTQVFFNNLNKGNLAFYFKELNTKITSFQQYIEYLLSDEILDYNLLIDLFTKIDKRNFYERIFNMKIDKNSFGEKGYMIVIIEIISLKQKLVNYFTRKFKLTNNNNYKLIINNLELIVRKFTTNNKNIN